MKWRLIQQQEKTPLCAHCHKTVRRGQVLVSQKLGPQHPITDRVIHFHGSCLRSIVDDLPPDETEQNFHDLRDRIAVTGMAFPD